MAGTTTTLAELVELAYGADTAAATWAAWQLVTEGLYFSGTPAEIQVHSAETVAEIEATRAAKVAAEETWNAFLGRLQAGHFAAGRCPGAGRGGRVALEEPGSTAASCGRWSGKRHHRTPISCCSTLASGTRRRSTLSPTTGGNDNQLI
ncbi:MAG: hypothetical protein R2867_33980 [Caldilineaceae bacterium]